MSGDNNSDDGELTEKQREVISQLPATNDELAESLMIQPSSVRTRIMSIREKFGEGIITNENGLYVWNGNRDIKHRSRKHKSTITKEANRFLDEEESKLVRALNQRDPVNCPDNVTTESEEDIVLHFTDWHVGDVTTNEDGVEVYNTKLASRVPNKIYEKVTRLRKIHEDDVEFGTLHIVLGGDMVTNEAIYEGQYENIDSYIRQQIRTAALELIDMITAFAEDFKRVQVVPIKGNHGAMRASGSSSQANADLLLYDRIEDILSMTQYENIEYMSANSKEYRNFKVRGWTGHLRHGQNCQAHADATSASKRDWRGWLHKHDFDFALRGHYHESKRESILNHIPVIMSPSPKIEDDFAELIGDPDIGSRHKLATVFGVSDNRPISWEYVIDTDTLYNGDEHKSIQ